MKRAQTECSEAWALRVVLSPAVTILRGSDSESIAGPGQWSRRSVGLTRLTSIGGITGPSPAQRLAHPRCRDDALPTVKRLLAGMTVHQPSDLRLQAPSHDFR